MPLKPGKAICGGNWGNNQYSQSHESFILVVTDIGQEMFGRRRSKRVYMYVSGLRETETLVKKNYSTGTDSLILIC